MGNLFKAITGARIAQGLFILNGGIWILFGVLSLIRMANGVTDNSTIMWIVSILMFANAGVMLWLGWGIGKGQKRFYILAVAVLAVNIILTVTDEFGALDLVTLLLDVALLGLLIATRFGRL